MKPQKQSELEPVNLDIKNVQKKVALRLKNSFKTLNDLRDYLVGWWCTYYRKPQKSEETLKAMENYTLEELLIEYFEVYFRNNPTEVDKFLSGESDESKTDAEEDEKWIEEQMGKDYLSVEDQESMLKTFEKDIRAVKDGDTYEGKHTPKDTFVDLDEFKDD